MNNDIETKQAHRKAIRALFHELSKVSETSQVAYLGELMGCPHFVLLTDVPPEDRVSTVAECQRYLKLPLEHKSVAPNEAA